MFSDTCKRKVSKVLGFVCIVPIIGIHTILRIIGGKNYRENKSIQIKKSEKEQTFEDDLAIVAIAKNEGNYIEEWLAYYKSIGVNRVYLYENNSTDNMKEKAQPFIDSGFVVYHNFPGEAKQLPAYNHAIQMYGQKTRFMAMADCDEFLMPVKDRFDLYKVVSNIFQRNPHAGGVGGKLVRLWFWRKN